MEAGKENHFQTCSTVLLQNRPRLKMSFPCYGKRLRGLHWAHLNHAPSYTDNAESTLPYTFGCP